jgi:hypothetical protein
MDLNMKSKDEIDLNRISISVWTRKDSNWIYAGIATE